MIRNFLHTFDLKRNKFSNWFFHYGGNAGGIGGASEAGLRLLEDGTSFRLLEDGASLRKLDG